VNAPISPSLAVPVMKDILARVATGESLSETEAESAFEAIMSGDATPAQIGAFLMALRVRGETVPEITAAARIMRSKALFVEAPPDAVDTAGTGGDGFGSYNISTAAALVIAACGIPVAKHGNRALSSKSGSADVLSALGVKIDADISLVKRCLWENKIGFLMAPRHHSAARHVAGARVELGTRTIFNLLGPLANPCGARRQIVGVFSERWLVPMAEVLGRLGAVRAWVMHGADGLDELTTTGPTAIAEWHQGTVRTFTVTPTELGLAVADPADLKGGDAETNAKALQTVLDGDKSAYRDIVLLNAAAGLVVADAAPDLSVGLVRAAQAVDDGSANRVLQRLITITHEAPAE
jgi:anthranilate phosphoribosyltransferase